MNRNLDQLKSAKGPGSNPTEPTQGPSVGFGGSSGSAISKNEVARSDGPFTPWHPPVSPNEVERLHALTRAFAQWYRLSEAATHRIIAVAKCQPAATIPEDIRAFERDAGESRCGTRQPGGGTA